MLIMKFLEDFWMGSENLKGNWMGYELFGERIVFPSTPVQGINNDQSPIKSYSGKTFGWLARPPPLGIRRVNTSKDQARFISG